MQGKRTIKKLNNENKIIKDIIVNETMRTANIMLD